MTQEEIQLLTKDLCARLPYGVMVSVQGGEFDSNKYPYQLTAVSKFGLDSFCKVYNPVYTPFGAPNIEDVKPYLRSMSSMTEEEKEEIEVFIFNEWYEEDSCKIDNEGWIEILANYDVSGIDPRFCGDYVDWLNANHFDWRGLIPMGLALEAPKGMYKD